MLNHSYTEYVARQRSNMFYLFCLFLLVFISAFRGPFATDYLNYVDLFYRFGKITLNDLLSRNWNDYPETGYLLFQLFCRNILDNPVIIFVFSSLIIVFAHIHEIQKYYSFGLLAIILFVDVGEYYSYFNLLRQGVAASIIILGSKYLYNRNFLRFLVVVLIASSIHKSSLIMIPFYFIAPKKTNEYVFFVYGILFVITFIFSKKIIFFTQLFYWDWYSEKGFGMAGYSFKNVIAPLFIVATPTIIRIKKGYNKKSYQEHNYEKMEIIWENAAFLYLFFSLLGMKIMMAQRFCSFFSLYAILYFCHIIRTRIINKELFFTLFIVFSMCFGFFAKLNSSYNPFTFIWE